ncbi:hypothetical protein TREPR_0842 [Treponema primitia ZAS-2]|uniref:DUF5723 domain-containing protein n=1 Tax=Treponema primitia (strain ATCC BAA-887 / DSM 12427 / ZAS-2) TaxID=545694 RepID=F5YIQ4_TREPZ|nr:hypothetical protein [Treponema primitia]AEF86515.1 hypothetical protein TREPR_0842 [Treponema primitia ZAS-2]
MKRLLLLILLGCAAVLQAADKPRRFGELGVNARASFANSYLRTVDVLQETLTLDFSKTSDELNHLGLGMFMDSQGGAYFTFNSGTTWAFGLFANADVMGQFLVPQSLMDLISKGNKIDKTYSDNFGLGAAAFFEAGAWFSKDIERIRFTFRPAYYLPLAYMSSPLARYSLITQRDGTVNISGDLSADVYLPSSLDDMSSFNVDDILNKGGIDLTLRAEYPLRHNLTVGATLVHIPFFPAQLDHRYNMTGSFSFKSDMKNIISDIGDGLTYEFPESEASDTEKVILRPFKIGFDAVYRPFDRRIFSLKPNLGLVFNSIYDTPVYADFGLTAEFNIFSILVLDAGTHYEDLIWKERLGLALNFRIIEFDVGLTLQSQDFVKSFNGAGYGVDLGVRLGF